MEGDGGGGGGGGGGTEPLSIAGDGGGGGIGGGGVDGLVGNAFADGADGADGTGSAGGGDSAEGADGAGGGGIASLPRSIAGVGGGGGGGGAGAGADEAGTSMLPAGWSARSTKGSRAMIFGAPLASSVIHQGVRLDEAETSARSPFDLATASTAAEAEKCEA